MKLSLALALLSTIAVAGCATEPSLPPAQVDDGLTLTAERPEHITGSYLDPDRGLALVFDSIRQDDQLELHLATAAGVALIDADTTADSYRFSYLGGRLTMTVAKTWVEEVRSQGEDGAAAQDQSALHWDGDMAVLDEMLTVPEVAVLPFMSRALGVRGFTGSAFPASLALHKLARQSADALAVELPALDSAGDTLFCTRPTYNECYGMCGPGCTCWSWVCGDCCYHTGCAKHDSWCRQGQWYYCYNITAVIALFGC